MVALIIDNSISQVADIVSEQIVSALGIALFVVISAIYGLGQYFILEIVKAKNREARLTSLRFIERIVTIVQYVLTSIIILVIIQILISSHYYKDFLTVSTTLSYGIGILIMNVLAWKLFFWFKADKKVIVLLYALTASFVVINAIFTVIGLDLELEAKSDLILPSSEVIFEAGYEEGSIEQSVLDFLYYTQHTFIFLLWGGTMMLLYHNTKKIGVAKFWILAVLPLVFYISTFIQSTKLSTQQILLLRPYHQIS